MQVIPKRIPILDSIYKRVETMLIAEGFIADWVDLKSLGNGSSAIYDTPQLNVAFKNETPSPEAGQSLYHLTAPIIISGYMDYDLDSVLSDQDYEVQKAHSTMIEDMRLAFGVASLDMCLAGVLQLTYIDEVDEPILSGKRVSAKLEFEIKWRDSRYEE